MYSNSILINSNTPPNAYFYTINGSGNTISTFTNPENIYLSNTSFDPDGTITNYSWDFGDGRPANSNFEPSHAYLSNGVYSISLTAIDDNGVFSTFSNNINYYIPGQLFTSSSNIAFGVVGSTVAATNTIILSNTGGSVLNITNFVSSLAQYTFGNYPTNINPNQGSPVDVYFNPGTAGAFNGNLTLYFADGNSQLFSVTGTGSNSSGVLINSFTNINYGNVFCSYYSKYS